MAVDRVMPRKKLAEIFRCPCRPLFAGISVARKTARVEAKPIPGRSFVKGANLRGRLPSRLQAPPDLTREEHTAEGSK